MNLPITPAHLVCILLVTISCVYAQKDALRCQDHPLYKDWFHPPLIKSWDQHERPSEFDKVVYHINFDKVTYRPKGDSSSNKYERLDLFHNTGIFASKGRLSTLYFQRPVKIYMFIGMSKRETRPARFSGWKSEGYAEIAGSDDPVKWEYGVFQKEPITFPKIAYVFSKSVTNQITLPTKKVVLAALKPLRTQIYYHFLVAESNGKPYSGSKRLSGKAIQPNRPCPEALHRAWRVRHSDNRDSDIKGKTWPSWHPQWDPCFWCTYGHDHGASAKHLMDYEPTFTYAAWKNKREKESDEGFKSYVMKYGQYWLYVNVHVQVGRLRRVTARYHTIAITIIKMSNGEKMLELTHKADFGFLSARGKGREVFIPLTKKDELMKKEMMKDRRPKFRSVNVINPAKIDPRFRYLPKMFEGVYEAWQTIPMCSLVGPNGGLQIDIRTPASGIKTVAQKEYVPLRVSDTRRNVGLSRVIRMRTLNLGAEHCPFKTKGGVFYTNADGTKMFTSPGPGRIRQFIKPGFKIRIDGRFEPLNAGLGLYGRVLGQHYWDHGFGMNPDKN